jgi:hypothetical protein
VAWGNVAVHVHSDAAGVNLFGFAVAIVVAFGSRLVKAKSKTATIIRPPEPEWTVDGWLEREGVKLSRGKVVLFKRVSSKFQTQEGTKNETIWKPGTTLTHPAWSPAGECGPGKFHACSRPYFCDEFRSERGDVYVAIEVAKKDLHAHPNKPAYPHKIAFRKGKVIGLVTRNGKVVAA